MPPELRSGGIIIHPYSKPFFAIRFFFTFQIIYDIINTNLIPQKPQQQEGEIL